MTPCFGFSHCLQAYLQQEMHLEGELLFTVREAPIRMTQSQVLVSSLLLRTHFSAAALCATAIAVFELFVAD